MLADRQKLSRQVRPAALEQGQCLVYLREKADVSWSNGTLNFSETSKTSGTYVLNCDYGMPLQGTRRFINGGTHLHREGKWVITKCTPANSSFVIYKLDPDKPEESISFIRLNENLLHLLDEQKQLMIGNGEWSYTLSRVIQWNR